MNLKSNFLINWIELKFRIIYIFFSWFINFCLCFYYKIELFYFISKFLINLNKKFIYIHLLDPIIIFLKLSILISFLLTLPIIIYNILFFISKSLHQFYVFFFVIFFFTLFNLMIFFFTYCYIIILPIIIIFLTSFEQVSEVDILQLSLNPTINHYFAFFFSFLSFFLLLFIILSFFFLLSLIYINDSIFINNFFFRKYLYGVISILFIFFAPPDITIQIIIFPVLIIFLELIIYFFNFWYHVFWLYNKSTK